MEEQVLGVTKLVNALLGKPALALLAALHIHPENPEYPIPNHIAMELVVFLIAIVFFTWLKTRLSVDNPGGAQQCMEALLTNPMGVGARDLLEDTAGHNALTISAHDRQHRHVCLDEQSDQSGSRIFFSDGGEVGASGLRDRRFSLLQLGRLAASRTAQVRQDISWDLFW